jgi:hypothetical protein
MITQLIKRISPWTAQEGKGPTKSNTILSGKFILKYGEKEIGVLEYKNKTWIFKYTEEYKRDQFILPLVNFPDITKTYIFEELLPFFATRIPTTNQPFHEKKIKAAGGKEDEITLLQLFGLNSINNPFQLQFVEPMHN